jgi:hypothetical protein
MKMFKIRSCRGQNGKNTWNENVQD